LVCLDVVRHGRKHKTVYVGNFAEDAEVVTDSGGRHLQLAS
jgi:hypothetical protein